MTYSPVEDRILLRIRTTQNQQFLFWLTRRYVGILWSVLDQMLKTEVLSPPAIEPAVQCNLSAEHPISDPLLEATRPSFHEKDVASVASTSADSGSLLYPLGENPVLLANIEARKQSLNDPTLSMHPEQGEGIEIVANTAILRTLRQILQETAEKAEWHIPLGFTPGMGRIGQSQEGLN